MPPRTKPDDWNQPAIIIANNCYNYATDIMFQRQPFNPLSLQPAYPGRGGTRIVQLTIGRDRARACASLEAACRSDGLHDEQECKAKKHKDCWRVAYFVRPETDEEVGDYHFVREDKPGEWSHKCCRKHSTFKTRIVGFTAHGNPVEGERILDPADPTKPVKPGYVFCDYLYTGPSTRPPTSVRALTPRRPLRDAIRHLWNALRQLIRRFWRRLTSASGP